MQMISGAAALVVDRRVHEQVSGLLSEILKVIDTKTLPDAFYGRET